MQQNQSQRGRTDERIVVYIMLKLDWVDALTSHNENKFNNACQLVLFDFIGFIDDSFHLAC